MVGGAFAGGDVAAASLLLGLVLVVVVQRLLELCLARSNERWARARGAREVGRRHYPAFFVLHGAWLVGWVVESVWGGVALASLWFVWLGVFAGAELLRSGAIRSLGRRWNTRILVFDGVAPVARGPYRILAHPNYVAVALELVALPLVFGAVVTAAVASVLNTALLLGVRIPAEQRALELAQRAPRARLSDDRGLPSAELDTIDVARADVDGGDIDRADVSR